MEITDIRKDLVVRQIDRNQDKIGQVAIGHT